MKLLISGLEDLNTQGQPKGMDKLIAIPVVIAIVGVLITSCVGFGIDAPTWRDQLGEQKGTLWWLLSALVFGVSMLASMGGISAYWEHRKKEEKLL